MIFYAGKSKQMHIQIMFPCFPASFVIYVLEWHFAKTKQILPSINMTAFL